MSDPLRDYIRANRTKYTREAVTQQLEQSGHDRRSIDAAWDEIAGTEPPGGQGRNVGPYVWIVYWLGAALIGIPTLVGVFTGSGMGVFGVGWLIAYLLLAYLPARALARTQPAGGAGVAAVVVAAPIIFLLIGGGVCIGTVLAFLGVYGL